jgi:hypothetical protein
MIASILTILAVAPLLTSQEGTPVSLRDFRSK